MKEELFKQYGVFYQRENGKWERDGSRFKDYESASKQLKKLQEKGKYIDYKIRVRYISLWEDVL